MKPDQIDADKLYFPSEIAEVIGLSVNELGYLKKKGCPFHGRKTTVRWVRGFIARLAGVEVLPAASISGHLQH